MNCPMDYPPGIYIYISIFFSLYDYLYFSATRGIVKSNASLMDPFLSKI